MFVRCCMFCISHHWS